MNKDKAKGEANETAGAMKRKAGEWSGSDKLASEGRSQEMKGKVQGTVGAVKDKASDVKKKVS